MNMKSQIADVAIKLQHKVIQRELLSNRNFLKEAGLNYQGYSGIGVIAYEELIRGMLLSHSSGSEVEIKTEEGESFLIGRDEAGPYIYAPDKNETRYLVKELDFLSPAAPIRSAEFDRREIEGRPNSVSTAWQKILQERTLEESEFADLSKEIALSPGNIFDRISRKWEAGSVKVSDIFPSESEYYERLSGLKFSDFDVTHLSESLRSHHQILISHDAASGLRCALAANLRQDLGPDWLAHSMSEDELLRCLEILKSSGPFTNLSIFALAYKLMRKDERFCPIAVSALKCACGSSEQNQARDRLFSALVRVGLAQIANTPGMAVTPVTWRNLCCFIHCEYLVDIISNGTLDLPEFEKFCEDACNSMEFSFAELVALGEGPMWRWARFTSENLRSELLGRAFITIGNAAEVYDTEADQEIRTILETEGEAIKRKVGMLSMFLPGPLEAHLRKDNPLLECADNSALEASPEFNRVLSNLRANPFDPEWGRLEFFSHAFRYSDEYRENLKEIANGVQTLAQNSDALPGLGRMLGAIAFIAASHCDEKLALTVVNTCLKFSREIVDRFGVQSIARVIVLSAAFAKEREIRNEWLGVQFGRLALGLERGEQCIELARCIACIRDHISPEHSRLSRAYYLALAGI